MIAFLSGKIQNKGNSFVIVRVSGVGYKVFVNSSFYADLSMDSEADFYIYNHVREDAFDLYGFKSMEEMDFFEQLLSISGIGPKSALGVLAVGDVESIKESIVNGDASLLTKVSGIGKKTAERVVLELREKISALTPQVSGMGISQANSAKADEIDALMALGYSLSQARQALGQIDKNIKDSGDRIKGALGILGK